MKLYCIRKVNDEDSYLTKTGYSTTDLQLAAIFQTSEDARIFLLEDAWFAMPHFAVYEFEVCNFVKIET